MKILMVIHSFLPDGIGGSEIYTYNLSKELAKRHQVYVFRRISDPQIEEYAVIKDEYDGLPVYKINNTWRDCKSFETTYKNDHIAEKFAQVLDEIKPDIVHFHHLTCLSTTLVHKTKERNIPSVYTLHDYWLICQRGQMLDRSLNICRRPSETKCAICLAYQVKTKTNKIVITGLFKKISPELFKSESWLRKIFRFSALFYLKIRFNFEAEARKEIKNRELHLQEVCSLVDCFIAPSKFIKNKFLAFGVPDNKIIYFDNGINTALFEGFSRTPSPRVRFGYIGTILPSKGLHILIKAFNRIKHDNASLSIFGVDYAYEGYENYYAELKESAANRNIKFMGKYDNKDTPKILSEIDVLIVPSIWPENSPLTVKEGFMSQTPVIASNIGGMVEQIIKDKSAFLFELSNDIDLRAKINQLISNPDLLRKSSESSVIVKSIRQNCEELEKIYSVI